MHLRRATASDAPGLAQVHVDSWQAAYKGIVPDDFLQRFNYQKREEAFREAIDARTEETYIAEENDHPVGILTIGACRDSDLDVHSCAEIWGIYLSPMYWRRGIGKTLLQEGERILQGRGFRKIVLWVLEGNAAARSFYEAMGFCKDGITKVVTLGAPLNAVRYVKNYPPQ